MDIKNGIKLHNEKWEEQTGEKSDFSRTLSPTSRNAWRIIRKMPVQIVENILKGLHVVNDEITDNSKLTGSKTTVVCASVTAVVLPTLCATLGSHFLLPSWLVGVSTLAVAAISTGVSYKIFKGEKAPISSTTGKHMWK